MRPLLLLLIVASVHGVGCVGPLGGPAVPGRRGQCADCYPVDFQPVPCRSDKCGDGCGPCEGCGELYVDPWINHPPTCDPCDACGNHNGGSCGACRPTFRGFKTLWGYRCDGCPADCDRGGCDGGCDGCDGGCDRRGPGGGHVIGSSGEPRVVSDRIFTPRRVGDPEPIVAY